MSKSSNKWVAVGLLGVAGVGAWMLGQRMFGGDDAVAESAKHAVNQVWIERLPTDQRDMVHHLVLVRHARGRIGAVGRSSQWRHFVELFRTGGHVVRGARICEINGPIGMMRRDLRSWLNDRDGEMG